MPSLFDFNKDISFDTDARIRSEQVNLHTLLGTMKIDDCLVFYNFHSEGDGDNIRILVALHPDSYSIAAIKNIKYLALALNLSIFAAHGIAPPKILIYL